MTRTRKVVKIDEAKCNGCGQCVSGCAEGALAIVDGKARLVSEVYCDGLGACLGTCPEGAITVEEREAEPFDEVAVARHAATAQQVERHECPGLALRAFASGAPAHDRGPEGDHPSQLGHWPVQLRLVPPGAPFLQGADLLISADCVPFAVADFHERFLAGRAVLVGCPKLDDIAYYRGKLKQILAAARPASITVLRMEVPCCAALARAVIDARDEVLPQLPVHVCTIGVQGNASHEVLAGLCPIKEEEGTR